MDKIPSTTTEKPSSNLTNNVQIISLQETFLKYLQKLESQFYAYIQHQLDQTERDLENLEHVFRKMD